MSQSASANKFNVLQPSFGHGNSNRLPPSSQQQSVESLKASEPSPFQRTAVRKSLKAPRRLPQQNLPVRDTLIASPSVPTVSAPPTPVRVGTKNSLGPDPPASVARRNARERNRVKQVNTGFAVLRQHIPVLCGSVIVYGGSPQCSDSSSSSSSPPSSGGSSKKNKMSKVETLRCAVEYIRNLEKLLASAGGPLDDDQILVKDEPLDCLFDGASGSSSVQESRENISPIELGLSTSGNDLSGFYDSSSSPESHSPEHQQSQQQRFLFPFLDASGASPVVDKRIKTEEDLPESAALLKQELLRTLSCWNRSDQGGSDSALPELLLDQTSVVGQSQISDQSLLESLNSWWCPNL